MSWRYEKAQSEDFNRLNELFIEMLKTIYNTEQAGGYPAGALDRFFDGRDDWKRMPERPVFLWFICMLKKQIPPRSGYTESLDMIFWKNREADI